jgi:hypothetical protein
MPGANASARHGVRRRHTLRSGASLTAADAHAVRAARAAQNAAIVAGDLDAVMSFWTEDITCVAPLAARWPAVQPLA